MLKLLRIAGHVRRFLRVLPLFLAFFVTLIASSVYADNLPEHFAAPEEGWKVGLVLSGGGARGAAHIGVLRVIEELKIPLHCIAGTSIGAIVGSMYAAGL